MAALYKLYYGWTAYFSAAWPTAPTPFTPPDSLQAAWRSDDIDLLAIALTPHRAHLVLRTNERPPPAFLAQRLKGRLQKALREGGGEFPGFRRAFLLRSLGQNNKQTVDSYIRDQVNRSDLVDPLYRTRLNQLRFYREQDDREQSDHKGIYDVWLHLVLVTNARYRMSSAEARATGKSFQAACSAQDIALSRYSIMPDHAHLLVRAPYSLSAREVLGGVKNGSGRALKRLAFWQDGGYAGTVGPYPLQVALDRNRAHGWCRGPRPA